MGMRLWRDKFWPKAERMLATVSFGLSRPLRYTAAVGMVVAALALRLAVAPAEAGLPFLTFFPAAAISAIVGGLGPGLVAAGLGAILACHLFFPVLDQAASLAVLIFLADGLIVCGAIEGMRRYYRHCRVTGHNLERTVGRLVAMNAELERFGYVASHDLQEPLRAIVSFSQLIARNYGDRLDDTGREYLDFLVEAGRRMQGLVAGLQDYSRLTVHPAPRYWINSSEIVHRSLVPLADAIRDTGAGISVEPLPSVWANGTQLTQVFEHLLGNALKFRAAGRRPVISVTCRLREDEWIFSVADNGIGFDPTEMNVFEIFRQLHPRGTFPGQGVGLALCRHIVGGHGGRIWVESRPGNGSTFHFTLPLPARGELFNMEAASAEAACSR